MTKGILLWVATVVIGGAVSGVLKALDLDIMRTAWLLACGATYWHLFGSSRS